MTLSLDISDTAAEMIRNHAALRHVSVSEFVVGAVLDKIEGASAVKRPKARDEMTDEEFDAMIERGFEDIRQGRGMPVDEAFAMIRKELGLGGV